MPKINQLTSATSLANTDLIITDTSTGSNTRAIAYSNLRTQIQNESASVFAAHGEIASDQQVATAVGNWLDANVTPTGSAVAIDDTLLISGAAADAQATGKMIVINGTSAASTRVNITTSDTDVELAEMSDVNELKNALQYISGQEGPVENLSFAKVYGGANNRAYSRAIKLYGNRYRIISNNATYQFCGTLNGTQIYSGWINSFSASCVPGDVLQIWGRRTDNADLADADLTALDSAIELTVYNDIANTTTKYVSTSGNDYNSGDATHPFKTVNKALEVGAETIYIQPGEYTDTIDVSKAKNKIIRLFRADPTGEVVFTPTVYKYGGTESKVSGYTKIYSIYSSTGFPELSADNLWIYQDGVPDPTTLISDSDRHPLQKGYTNRCGDTKIVKTTATDPYQALPEIDAATEYKWFLSANKNYLYYSRPQTVDSSHPLCYSDGSQLFVNNNNNVMIYMTGITCKYKRCNVTDFASAELNECRVKNCFAVSGFYYSACQNAIFRKCEASHIQSGLIGDGFSAHGSYDGEVFAENTNAILIDCYSHDNNDDGFSDHQRCTSTLIGGLYEWNTKGGVTPSYGSHCTCYNVLSRNNYVGFLCTGDVIVAEGGKYTQMACYNCIAENNNRGGYMSGFRVNGAGNRGILYNCTSKGNTAAYGTASDAQLDLYDCRASGYNVVTQNNVTTHNSDIVTVS